MVRSLQLINMPPRFPPLPPSRATHAFHSFLLFSLSLLHIPLFSLPQSILPYHSFPLCHSQLVTACLSLPRLLPFLLSPPSLSPCLGALMASMYSSSDTVTSAGREGLSLTTQPANEIFPHLINTIRILILTESI